MAQSNGDDLTEETLSLALLELILEGAKYGYNNNSNGFSHHLTEKQCQYANEQIGNVLQLILADRKQHELDAKIDTLETIKMLNPHSGLMQVDSYDESDSGDAYVFVTLDEKIGELKAEREEL